MISNVMKMGNVLSDGEARQRFASSTVCAVGGNDADNLDSIGFREVQNGSSTNAIDGNPIDEVGVSKLLSGTDIPREKTECGRGNGRESEPTNLSSNIDELAHWKKCYGSLWKLKFLFEEKNYR